MFGLHRTGRLQRHRAGGLPRFARQGAVHRRKTLDPGRKGRAAPPTSLGRQPPFRLHMTVHETEPVIAVDDRAEAAAPSLDPAIEQTEQAFRRRRQGEDAARGFERRRRRDALQPGAIEPRHRLGRTGRDLRPFGCARVGVPGQGQTARQAGERIALKTTLEASAAITRSTSPIRSSRSARATSRLRVREAQGGQTGGSVSTSTRCEDSQAARVGLASIRRITGPKWTARRDRIKGATSAMPHPAA
jgi:hypothetical protein